MESKPAEPGPGAEHLPGVSPEMRLGPEEARAPRRSEKSGKTRKRRIRGSTLLSAVSALVGVSALAASGWVYSQTHREVLRLATDVAQLRISLDLYAQRGDPMPAATPVPAGPTSAELSALSNRLSVIEQNMRGVASPTVPSLPSITGGTETSAGDGDCLPPGMRILVAVGDSYGICGTSGSITVAGVENGYMSLSDGSTIASGGTLPLAGTNCLVGVTSGGDEGVTGYAEIRVSC